LLVVGSEAEIEKILEGLSLIKRFDRIRYDRITRDVARIWVRTASGSVARFVASTWTCDLDWRFVLDEATAPELIAVTIVHEATHARLFRCGIGYGERMRARVEEVCLRREVAFAARLPAGTQAHERAAATLVALPDLSNEAMYARSFDGSRDAMLQLGAPPWLVRSFLAVVSWRNRRRSRGNQNR
jgi:hypothetical protein